MVENFNLENGSANDETDSEVNSLDPLGGYDPFGPSSGKKHEYQNGENGLKFIVGLTDDLKGQPEHGEPPGGNRSVTSIVPPLENENIRFAPDGIDINARLYDAGMFYNKCYPKNADLGEKKTSAVTPSGRFCGELDDNASLGTNAEVELKQFIQKFGENKSMLLDVMSKQLHKLDKEIQLHENVTTANVASPAEKFKNNLDITTLCTIGAKHDEIHPENKPCELEMDLSKWLTPISGPGGF